MTDAAGKVYLIGAGPGDPGLFTLKGKRCLEEADVVAYDALANRRLLAHAKPNAETIYVGKRGGQNATSGFRSEVIESWRAMAVEPEAGSSPADLGFC